MLKLNVSKGGRLIGQLELPMPLNELKRRVDEFRAAGQLNITPVILSADSPVPALDWHLQLVRLDSAARLQALNRLAEAIGRMNTIGHYHLSRALSTDYQQDLGRMLQKAAHIKPGSLDNYEIIPGVAAHEALGRWLVERDHLEEKAPESLRCYLKYEDIGIDYHAAHAGEFMPFGYMGIRTGALERVLEEQRVLLLTLTLAGRAVLLGFPTMEDELEDAAWILKAKDLSQARIVEAKLSNPRLAELIPLEAVTLDDAVELARRVWDMELEDGGLAEFQAALEAERPASAAEAFVIARGQAQSVEQAQGMGGMV